MSSATTQPEFHRARHLAFAFVGLLHGPMAMRSVDVLALFVDTFPWTARLEALDRLAPLCLVAFVAWLAFEVFDTRAGVSVLPRRWADVGLVVLALVFVQEVVTVSAVWRAPADVLDQLLAEEAVYMDSDGELRIGWLVLGTLAGAIAEELVYRALLLRALEGYMKPAIALVVQALAFEAVHVGVYGYPFQGGNWFVMALIYGYAFQRTRSLAVPVLLHAAHNILFYATVWFAAL